MVSAEWEYVFAFGWAFCQIIHYGIWEQYQVVSDFQHVIPFLCNM